MPPDLDIYVVSRARNRKTIERFLQEYVDLDASQDRGDEDLMMVPFGVTETPDAAELWDWEPAKNLKHVVQRGLDEPHRAFAVYLKPRDSSLTSVTMAFRTDGCAIFGLSIDDEGMKPENAMRARSLLHTLADAYEGERGWIGIEMPAPLIAGPGSREVVEYEWHAEST